MDVARLNFSHGSYEQHAQTIAKLREISLELDTPVTILQDLQGPKIRVGQLPGGEMVLGPGKVVAMIPEAEFTGQPATIPLDYSHAAEEAKGGMRILLDDGLMQLEVLETSGNTLRCRVVDGGVLKSRKGVNFPELNLRRLPSLTEKDKEDLKFGLSQDVDWISLSFVRSAEDVHSLRELIAAEGVFKPVVAKIEKPQAIENLEGILRETNGVMVARGDLGVELNPEKVPMLQKHIIESCNRKGTPGDHGHADARKHDPRSAPDPRRGQRRGQRDNRRHRCRDALRRDGRGSFPGARRRDDGPDRPRSRGRDYLQNLPGRGPSAMRTP